jgi:hypothetical protein
MGTSIRLRILTEKSVLQEGKYANVPIGQLIDLGHTAYLRYVYYTYSNISFTDNVLFKIYIRKDSEKIPKPGKKIEMVEILDKKMIHAVFDKKNIYFKRKNIIKKSKQASATALRRKSNVKFKKQNLAWKNQGH